MLHFTGIILAKAVGFELAHVPYGGPSGIQDLIGGRIAATIYPTGPALPYVQSGHIRALAITSTERNGSSRRWRPSGKRDFPHWKSKSGSVLLFRRIRQPRPSSISTRRSVRP